MRKLSVIALVLLTAAPILLTGEVRAAKRPFTIEDLYRLKSVRAPQFSPDGKRIAFYITEYFLEDGKSNADIYLMNADGSGHRRMTYHEKADYRPRWSPDGTSLLFLSTRKDGPQVWRIPANGGEAEQLTDFSMGVNRPMWFPDGRRILFFSEVFPECGADDGCNKELRDDLTEGTTQAHMADELLYRHWTFWKDGKRFHTFVYNTETEEYTDLTPGEMDAPAYVTGGHAGYDISPDGGEVCITATADENEWETTNKDLWIVSTSGGGELVNITDDNEAYDADPQYSPDGRYIAYIMQKVPRYEADLFRLAIFDRKTRQKTVLTDAFDNWVTGFKWSPDSRGIYFRADVEGVRPLYRVDINSKNIQRVVDLRTVDGFDIAPDGKSLAVSRRSIGEPSEIWSATTRGKSIKRLTAFNKEIEEEVDIRPGEEMWIDSPTGKKIHTFVVKPHDFDPGRKYPFILNVHGGPQGQWTDGFRGDWQVYPGAGYVLAFPNPHGSSGYGQELTRAISRDYGGKVYEDVMAVAAAMAALPWVDENLMGAMGWSYGGYMMNWIQGQTDRFKALVSMMGLYNLTSKYGATEELWFPQYDLGGAPWESEDYTKWSPNMYVKNFKTPCLIITGERDYRVSYTQSLELFTALQKMGVPSRLIVFKNDGHWPNFVKSMPLYYNAHLDWFHKYLGGDPAPYDVQDMVRNRAFEDEDVTEAKRER
jgi:dipeptidyl aminopeptidase/acylaminoacyl peptidase